MNSQAQRRRRQDSRSSSSCRKLSCHAVVTLLLLASEAPGVVSKHNHGHEHEDHGEEEDFSAIVAGLPPGFTFGAATAAYQAGPHRPFDSTVTLLRSDASIGTQLKGRA